MMDIRLQVFEMHRHLFHNKDVLDIGCNVGHISIAVARELGARSVLGIDIDSVLIGELTCGSRCSRTRMLDSGAT